MVRTEKAGTSKSKIVYGSQGTNDPSPLRGGIVSATNDTKRLVLGLALAPLVPGLLMLVLSLLGNPDEGMWSLKLIAMFAYPAMIVVGLPLHLLFQWKGWTSAWPYLIAGTLTGEVVAYFVFPTLRGAASATASSIAIAAICAFLGAITAAMFWLIVRQNTPKYVRRTKGDGGN